MTSLLRFFSFPLLGKELTETAARRRTYVLRVVYGLLLFGLFALNLPSHLLRGNYDVLSIMGTGRDMLEVIFGIQFFGIALFLPAMMCGRIAEEKERDSLVLLLLTDLGPWSIVLQKFLGGLVPMLSFLLLALPLGAISYAFGGVTTELLALGLWSLLLGCLQVGALALMCSAFCRTTVAALVSTYLLAAAFYLGPVLLSELSQLVWGSAWRLSSRESAIHIPPALLFDSPSDGPVETFVRSIPILLSIAVFLTLARVFLVRRAFAPASSFFLRLFRRLDGVMQRANRLTGHRLLLREKSNLPEDEPIAWREMTHKALGKVHYLVRILVVIELPILILCGFATTNDYSGQSELLSAATAIVGTLVVLALSVQAANTIVSERVQQTLEVLLTTPLTAREIVAQKARVLRRFMLVLAVPLLTIFGSEWYLEWGASARRPREDGPAVYLVCALLTVGILLPLVSWLSLWIGLKMRTRFKAILTALAVVVAWCVVPFIGAVLIKEMRLLRWLPNEDPQVIVLILSPVFVPGSNEMAEFHRLPFIPLWNEGKSAAIWLLIAVNFTFYAAMLFLFRHLALSRADRYLRR
jgi:ABC-type transport system involved in multi-copper enzyme maturation permease subunit